MTTKSISLDERGESLLEALSARYTLPGSTVIALSLLVLDRLGPTRSTWEKTVQNAVEKNGWRSAA